MSINCYSLTNGHVYVEVVHWDCLL